MTVKGLPAQMGCKEFVWTYICVSSKQILK